MAENSFGWHGLTKLFSCEEGADRLEFEADGLHFVVDRLPENGNARISVDICAVPEDDTRQMVLRELLEGNYMFAYTCGGTLSVDADGRRILMHQTLWLDYLDDDECLAIIGTFVTVAREWGRWVADTSMPNPIMELIGNESVIVV